MDTKTYNHHLNNFVNETVSKNVMDVVYFFAIKRILTMENGPVIDAIKSD